MKELQLLYSKIKSKKTVFWVMVIATIFVVAFSLINPLIISFVLDNVIKDEPLTNPITAFIVNLFGGLSVFKNNTWQAALVLIIFGLGAAFFQYLRSRSNAVYSEDAIMHLRNELYDHIQYLPYSYHQQTQTGDLIQRVTSDVDLIRRFLANQVSEFIYGIMTIVFAGIVLFSIHVKLALLSLVSIPFLILFAYFFFKKMQSAFKASDETEAVLSTVLQENIEGTRVVKAFNRETYELDRFLKANQEFKNKTNIMMKLLGYYWGISDFMVLLQILGTILGGIYFSYHGEITTGDFIVFISYISFILYPIRNLGRILSDFGKVTVSVDRLDEILREKMEDVTKGITPEIKGHIEFNDVTFKYEDGDQDILEHISFEILKGQTVAIMGPTGSGKSSLIHLLTKLYDYQGNILIDGYELKDISSEHIRKNIGLVLQEPFLFSKSILDNIKVSQPNADFSLVEKAARVASVDEVIKEFDQGYDTMVGEKGVTLSGGQKQRIAIARVIINNCPILIFDDSLSAVDAQTDANIREAFQTIQQDTTTIIITHRANTAMSADKIIVLENGKIAQEGSHAQLIGQEGFYRDIYDIQNQKEGL